MAIRCFLLVALLLPLAGCTQGNAPAVTVEKSQAAKDRVLEMNDEHQKKLEQLTLPGQD